MGTGAESRSAAVAAISILVSAVAWTAALLAFGASLGQIVAYALAFGWTVMLPGWAVVRRMWPRTSVFEDVCWGAVAGLCLQLLAWFVAVHLGTWVLTAYPLLAVPLLLSDRRRRRSEPVAATATAERVGISALGSLAVAAAGLLVLARVVLTGFRLTPLPPSQRAWLQDLYWHLSISSDAMHNAPPGVPQISGEVLHYHWFSNAHIAATTLVAHGDVTVSQVRLWIAPIVLLTLAATYAFAVRLAHGRTSAGIIALGVVVLPAELKITSWIGQVGSDSVSFFSPSQIFGLPLILCAAALLVEAVRGQLPPPGWLLLALTLLGAAGAKSSVLPVLLCGTLLAAVASLLFRSGRRAALSATALVFLVLVITAPFLAGGGGESSLGTGLFRTLAVGSNALRGRSAMDGSLALTATIVLLLVLVLHKAALLSLLSLTPRPWRDPGLLVLLGAVIAGVAATVLIDHPALSQVYFTMGTVPLTAVLTGYGLEHLLPDRSDGVRWPWWIASALVGSAVAWVLAHALTPKPPPSSGTSTGLFRLGITVALWCLVLGGAIWFVRRNQARGRPGRRRAGVMAIALMGALLVPASWASIAQVVERENTRWTGRPLPAGAVAAATWVRDHSRPGDVFATNVHCRDRPTRPHCDSRAFWLTGLSNRRAYVESWGYTDQARAAHGKDNYDYDEQLFHDPARLAVNDAAFTAPTAPGLAGLRRAGVRYLVADRGAGPVSPTLAGLATERFRSGVMVVYELPA